MIAVHRLQHSQQAVRASAQRAPGKAPCSPFAPVRSSLKECVLRAVIAPRGMAGERPLFLPFRPFGQHPLSAQSRTST